MAKRTLLPENVANTLTSDLNLMSFDDLMGMFDDGNVVHIQTLDDTIVFEKADLIGRPMVITNWRLSEGNIGEFVVCKIATKDQNGKNVHGIFTDGSTGIKEQLKSFQTVNDKPIYCPKGLRASNYTFNDPLDGKDKPATTYYLSNES